MLFCQSNFFFSEYELLVTVTYSTKSRQQSLIVCLMFSDQEESELVSNNVSSDLHNKAHRQTHTAIIT